MIELAGLTLAGVDAAPGIAGPTLINRDPAPGDANVPLAAPIALEITVPHGDALDVWSVRVWVQGTLAYDGSAAAVIAPAFAGPASRATNAPPTFRLVLDPIAPPTGRDPTSVRVVASSSKGARRIDETYAFTFEDTTPPVLVAAFATGVRGVRLAFDRDVILTPAASFALVPRETPAVRGAVASAVASGPFVDVTLAAPLSPGVAYEVTVAGISDPNGHGLPPPGASARFTAFRPPRPANRRFDLWSMLPKMNRRADATGDLRAFIACLQEVTDWLLADLDALPDHLDIERAPEWMLDRILRDLGNPFAFELVELEKRRLASILTEIYRLKGTAPGIRSAVRFFVGLDDLTITPLAATALVLGDSMLGEDWELGPSARWARYAFEVLVPRVLTDAERSAVTALVRYMKPAHAHFGALRDPVATPALDGWSLGSAELGAETVLG